MMRLLDDYDAIGIIETVYADFSNKDFYENDNYNKMLSAVYTIAAYARLSVAEIEIILFECMEYCE